MVEPKSVREVSLVVEGLEGRVALLQTLILSVMGMLGCLLAGAVAIYVSIGDVKTSVAIAHSKLDTVNTHIAAVNRELGAVRARDREILEALSRIETRLLAVSAPLQPSISADEAEFIRRMLRTPPRKEGVPKFSIGDIAPSDAKQLPDDVVTKIPRLRGVRFAYDVSTNAIGLIDPITTRIFAVI